MFQDSIHTLAIVSSIFEYACLYDRKRGVFSEETILIVAASVARALVRHTVHHLRARAIEYRY